MNILVTNDDGIYANGLWAVVSELTKVGDVTVVAPDRDQSGAGTSVTLRQPIRLHKIKSPEIDVPAYKLEGTPADTVIMALRVAMKDGIDLVVSGINEGSNLGNDVFISGTVGAALQGYAYGIPSIAVSVSGFGDLYYGAAARIAALIANSIKDNQFPKKLFLNVNLPNLPEEKITGIEMTTLGDRSYVDRVDSGHDGKREYYWIIRGIPEWSVVPGTDVWALEQNKISIMPFDRLKQPVDGFLNYLRSELLGQSTSIKK